MNNGQSMIRNQLGNEQDFLQKKTSELQLLNENTLLKKEIEFLNKINLRLGQELAELQVKCNIRPGQPQGQQDLGTAYFYPESTKIPNLGKNSSQIEALLIAYDEKISKMDRILETAYEDYKDMEKKTGYLVQDNNMLREQLESKCKILLNLFNEGSAGDNIGNALLKIERNDLNERINLLSDENKELYARLQDISEKHNEMRIRCEKQEIGSSENIKLIHELQEKLKGLEISYTQEKNQKEILENKLRQSVEFQVILEGDKQELMSKGGRNENEIKILKTQISILKRNQIDMEEKKLIEVEQLKREIDSLKIKDREGFQKQVTLEKELDFLKDENRRLMKDRETMKNEQEQMIRMMDNYQSKVQNFEKKEENGIKVQKEQREKLQNALLEKDKSVLRQQQAEKALQTLQDNHRKEFNEAKEQYERLSENLRNKQRQLLEEREQEIQELNMQLTEVNHVMDKLQKENATLEQEYKKFSVSLRDDFGGPKNEKIADYERRITELEEKLLITEQNNNNRLYTCNQEKIQIETNYHNQQRIIGELKSSNDGYKHENQKIQAENAQILMKLSQVQKDKQVLLEEISKTKRISENKLEYASSQFNYKMKDLQDQLNESLKRERTSREKAIELLQTHDRLEEKMRYEYENRIKELENLAVNLKEENKIITIKSKKIYDDHPNQDR